MTRIENVFNSNSLIRDYGNVEREIEACRTSAALFDFSFMTFIIIEGEKSIEAISSFSSRSISNMNDGQIRYSLYCNKDGYIVSDITIWRIKQDKYIIMSGRAQDYNDFKKLNESFNNRDFNIEQKHLTALSVQGPHCLRNLVHLIDQKSIVNLKYFHFSTITLFDEKCYVGRLGYTGERGFELVFPEHIYKKVWNKLITKINPAGFCAIDCLRIEAGFLLFCNEFSINVTPNDAGLQSFSKYVDSKKTFELICFTIKSQTNQESIIKIIKQYFAKQNHLHITSLIYSKRANGFLGLGYLKNDAYLTDNIHRLEEDNYYDFKVTPKPFYNPLKTKPLGHWNNLLLPVYE
jgi:glycine cleavage system aminomethyltransferase T